LFAEPDNFFLPSLDQLSLKLAEARFLIPGREAAKNFAGGSQQKFFDGSTIIGGQAIP
jgi:hypothetical protein